VSDVRGVILDVDGTLVDSNDAHAHAWVEALAEHDYDLPFEKIRRLIGMGGDKLLPAATGQDSQSEIGKRISERRREIFKTRYLPSIKPFPKVRELLSHMRERGLKLVVASSAQPDELDQLLEIAGAKRLVEDTTSSNDADNSKPDPDIVQVALHNLGYPPAEVVMLGDTPYDIEAATKAGINTVALLCGGWSEQDLSQALAIYADPADLLEHYESSPLG
jgi:HAD superfamily hydrolase (TIGR01509 family)